MASRQGKTTNSLEDYIETKLNEERKSQWGEMPAKIVSFDPVKQTATVQPLYKPKFLGQPVDMPQLEEVPIRFQRAGAGAITMPVKPGMELSIRPMMRSQENYTADGDGSASDDRSFSLSDMEGRFDGGTKSDNPIKNFDNENTHVRANEDGSFGMKLTPDGKLEIKGAQGEMVDMLAKQAELAAEGFTKLGTEATLTHRVRYGQIGVELTELAAKLRGTQKT